MIFYTKIDEHFRRLRIAFKFETNSEIAFILYLGEKSLKVYTHDCEGHELPTETIVRTLQFILGEHYSIFFNFSDIHKMLVETLKELESGDDKG